MKIVLAVLVLAMAGGGYLGWQEHQVLQSTRADLASTRASLDKAVVEARNAKTEADAARKAVEDQKAALEQAKSDADAAQKFLEMEKSHAARLQQELTLAREQIAYMNARSGGAARVPAGMTPMLAPSRIEAIRVAPAGGPRSYGAASPARPPLSSQEPARPQQ